MDHPPQSSSLELSNDEITSFVKQATQRIVAHFESLADQAVWDLDQLDPFVEKLKESLPLQGESYTEILDKLFDQIISKGFNSASPGYLAYVPSGGLVHAAIADLISNSVNRYVGVWTAAPGLVQIESNVIRWFCDIIGYAEGSGGFLTSGGSLANFSAVFTARRERLPDNFLDGILYTSDQAHHSVLKAAILCGFPSNNVRVIPSDNNFRLCTHKLQQQIQSDHQKGLRPFMLIASAGTTNTGVIDPLVALADIANQENLWFHVDAAYGGFFMLTERGRKQMKGINRADSVTLDPHKGLFLPYGTGCLLVSNANTLKRAHASDADYLPIMQDHPERTDFCQISPELSRDFRGLRVWLPIKMHGINEFRKTLDEKLDLARWITRKLNDIESIQIIAAPELSIVAFKIYNPGLETAILNAQTKKLLEVINSRRRVLLTGTLLNDEFVIRICVLCFRTHQQQIQTCLEDIVWACEQL